MKETKKTILYIFPFVFIVFFVGILVFSFFSKPRVMVVMSYSDEDLWEKQIKLALDKTFKENAPYFSVNYYYLNIRDNNVPSYIERVLKEVNKLIYDWKPQVLLLVDDDAQNYVGKRYLHNSKYNIVFSGVNADPAVYGYITNRNVTGIEENLHFPAMRAAIMDIFPNYNKFIYLSDDSTTARYFGEQIKENNWTPLELLEAHNTNSIVEWEKIIDKANAENAVILISHLQTVTLDKTAIPAKDVAQFILHRAKVPVISFSNFNVVQGLPFAISTSGLEQGEVAAKLAIKILKDKEKVGDIPFARSQYFDFSYNQEGINLNVPGIIIPPIYKSFSYLNTMLENSVYQKK